MNETTSKYCAECLRDFVVNEVVHYTWYENRCFCNDCKEVMNERVTPLYLDWKQRKVADMDKSVEDQIQAPTFQQRNEYIHNKMLQLDKVKDVRKHAHRLTRIMKYHKLLTDVEVSIMRQRLHGVFGNLKRGEWHE